MFPLSVTCCSGVVRLVGRVPGATLEALRVIRHAWTSYRACSARVALATSLMLPWARSSLVPIVLQDIRVIGDDLNDSISLIVPQPVLAVGVLMVLFLDVLADPLVDPLRHWWGADFPNFCNTNSMPSSKTFSCLKHEWRCCCQGADFFVFHGTNSMPPSKSCTFNESSRANSHFLNFLKKLSFLLPERVLATPWLQGPRRVPGADNFPKSTRLR